MRLIILARHSHRDLIRKQLVFLYSLILISCCFISPLPAQENKNQSADSTAEAQTSPLVPRQILLLFEPLTQTSLATEDLVLTYDSLLIKLSQDVTDALFIENPQQIKIPETDANKNALAVKIGADAWLWVGISSEPTKLVLQIRSWDNLSSKEVINLKIEKEDLNGLERHFWDELVEKLKATYKKMNPGQEGLPTQQLPKAGVGLLTLKAKPQTIIEGLSQKPLMIDETGELTVELQRLRTYTLRATCANYYPLTKTIYSNQDQLTLTLNQKTLAKWAMGLYLYNLTYPGLEGTFFLKPEKVFLRASFTFFTLHLPEWLETAYAGAPVIDFNFMSGFYYTPASSLFRGYLALGAMGRLMKWEGWLFLNSSETTLFYGFFPVLGFALAPNSRLQCYAEYNPLFYLQPSIKLKKLITDLLCLSLGIRYQF
jgi:hypothetical protein